jgi:glycolate oxidase
MVDPQLLASLREIVGAEHVVDDPDATLPYSFDATPLLDVQPGCVLFPRTTDQVAAVIRTAAAARVPVVTRGSGTGLSGGAVPVADCIVLCTVLMDQVIEVDAANLTARVQPGVLTEQLDTAAREHRLFYPPDPGSMKISTIGGNVANNSGGLRGLKYGVTRDYVMGLKVVLASGEVLETGTACVKDVAGYQLKDLFVGSEGTLGVITEILLRLLPIPAERRTMVATYDSMQAAAATVSAIIAHPIIPCTLEFLDQVTIRCVEDYAQIGLPTDAVSLLLMETDGHPAVVEEEAAAMREIAERHGATDIKVAADAAESARLATARRAAFSALARVSPTTILEDATVPRSRLVEMLEAIQRIADKHELKIGTFGHMGDGNLHPTFLTDERDSEEIHRVEEAFREIFEVAVSLGGTVTGEHGVGLAKKAFLPLVIGEVGLTVHRQLKQALDPEGILNPGKIFG